MSAVRYDVCPKEVATTLGISTRKARGLLRSGAIAGFKLGPNVWRTSTHHVEDYIARCLAEAQARRAAPTPPPAHCSRCGARHDAGRLP